MRLRFDLSNCGTLRRPASCSPDSTARAIDYQFIRGMEMRTLSRENGRVSRKRLVSRMIACTAALVIWMSTAAQTKAQWSMSDWENYGQDVINRTSSGLADFDK